jgi:uncharacterized protein (DUF1697 family)
MAIQIALLRAVNVGGRKLIMAELKAMFEAIGFASARTLLQSGNVVFDSGGKKGAALETLLEKETEARFKLRTDYLVRSAAEWKALVDANPFAKAAKDDPSHVVAVPLKSEPKKADVATLQGQIKGRETVSAIGRTLYITYPDGIGDSKLTIGMIEKALGTRGTARNWNTTLKLLDAAQ